MSKKLTPAQEAEIDDVFNNMTLVVETPRFRCNYNYVADMEREEINEDPSETVPDQSLTVQEIMQRHVQGRPIPRGQKMYYSGDDLMPPIHQMSELDQLDLQRAIKDDMAQKEQQIKDKRKARREAIKASKENTTGGEQSTPKSGATQNATGGEQPPPAL